MASAEVETARGSKRSMSSDSGADKGSCEEKKSCVEGVRSASSTATTEFFFTNHDSQAHVVRLSLSEATSAPRRKLLDLMYVERHPNGYGLTLHAYQEELCRLDRDLLDRFADKYFHNLFKEKQGRGHGAYCLGVVHAAAVDWPDLVEYLEKRHESLIVKVSSLEKKHELFTMTTQEYASRVRESYKNGTMRVGPMQSVSVYII